MKKRIVIFLAAVMAAICVQAEEWMDPDTGYTWEYYIVDGTAEIQSKGAYYEEATSPEPVGALTIPTRLDGHLVTSIKNAFSDCNYLTSVIITNSVRNIGPNAFYYCANLKSVTMSNRVTNIGNCAFYGCSGLTDITIPDSVTNIGYHAFRKCSGLTSVTIGDGVKNIRDYAFYDCSRLTAVYITDLTKWCEISLSGIAFDCAYDLYQAGALVENLTIPDSVTNIKDSAFRRCSSIKSVMIPNGVTNIGDVAFAWCSNLTSVTIGNGIEHIGTKAFCDCTGLTRVTIGNGVMSIGDYPFLGCTNVTDVVAPGWRCGIRFDSVTNLVISDGTTSIRASGFSECSALKSVTIPGSVTNIGKSAFVRCNGLTSVMIGNGVTSIGEHAFYNCSGLTSVTIPASVTSIEAGAFDFCSGLTNLIFKGDAPRCTSSLFERVFKCTIYVNRDSSGWGVEIPGRWNGLRIEYIDDDNPPVPANCTVSFNANGGNGTMAAQAFTEGVAQALARNAFTREGYTFDGWATSADGSVVYVDGQSIAVSSNMTLYAHWMATSGGSGDDPGTGGGATGGGSEGGESGGGATGGDEGTGGDPDPVTSEPVVTQQVWTVTFNANGGEGSMAAQMFTNGVAQALKENAFTRFGYDFAGWATSADGEVIYADGQRIAVTSGQTLYARWAEIVAGRLNVSFAKAQTVLGALYDKGNTLVGTVQVKVGKINKKKGTVLLSASATLLSGGKTKTVTAKATTLNATGTSLPQTVLTFKSPIGKMTFALAEDGTFTLKNDTRLMAEATVGGKLKGGARGTFRLEDFNLAVSGELQENLLPHEVAFSVSGGKWKFAKAATVKWAKDKKTKQYALVVDDAKGKTNLSSLKLTYTSKTGIFKGSFKAYALSEKKGKTKLATYTVNVLGFVVDGAGQGEARCKKPAGGPWPVTVE